MATLSLTSEQMSEFTRAGMLHLPAYFPASTMAEIAAVLWSDLNKRFGIERHNRETWTKERPAQFQSLIRSGAFDGLAEGLHAIADAFLGVDTWERPSHLCLPLITFPTGTWDVPHSYWHIDLPPEETIEALRVVRAFVLLEQLEPKGGGTCYVSGSHRVIADLAREAGQELRSSDVKALLKGEPWFADLFSKNVIDRERRFMIDGAIVRGVPLRLQEMVGALGDVYVMHQAILHTIADNMLDRPRMMLGHSFVRRCQS